MALSDLPIPLDLAPMEARAVNDLPAGPGWWFEPKWDGFRCLAFRDGADVELKSKAGKPLTRYFPEVAQALASLPVGRFVVDGELTVALGGEMSFDALQMRLHPAESRIRKLAGETPAGLVLFDCLLTDAGGPLLAAPLQERRQALEALSTRFERRGGVWLSPGTQDRDLASGWLDQVGAALDGVIAKRLDDVYAPGERAMLKLKRLRSADCVVGGFRYAQDGRQVGSLLLGLYDDEGLLHHVGFTSGISQAERPALTTTLEALAGPPGFTGAAPGGPSRWSNERSTEWTPLRPELVVEVRYDHVTGARFRHGTKLLRWRPDKAPRQCTFDQLQPPASAEQLVKQLSAA